MSRLEYQVFNMLLRLTVVLNLLVVLDRLQNIISTVVIWLLRCVWLTIFAVVDQAAQ